MDKIKHLENKFSVLTYELIRDCEDFELRFYAWIKLWAINKSSAFPGMGTIQNDLGWSKDKLVRAIKKMEAKGRLVVTRQDGKSNLYDITWYDKTNQSGSQTRGVRKSDGYQYGSQTLTNRNKLIENNYIKGNNNSSWKPDEYFNDSLSRGTEKVKGALDKLKRGLSGT